MGFGQEEGYFRNFNLAALFHDESSPLACRWIHPAKWSVNPGSLENVAPQLSCEDIVSLHDCDVYKLGGGRWYAVTPQNSLFSCLIFQQIYRWDSHCYVGKKKIFCSICHIWKLNFIAIFWEMGCTFKYFWFCFLVFFEWAYWFWSAWLLKMFYGRLGMSVFRKRKILYYFTKAFNCVTIKQKNFDYSTRSLWESKIMLYLESSA